MSYTSLNNLNEDEYEDSEVEYSQPKAAMLLEQFNDAWINNNWSVDPRWFAEDFRFVTPLWTQSCFTDFSDWFKQIMPSISNAEITRQYSSDRCACCIIDLTVGEDSSILRVVELVTFENNKISEIEWIFDPREVFEIFSSEVENIEIA